MIIIKESKMKLLKEIVEYNKKIIENADGDIDKAIDDLIV